MTSQPLYPDPYTATSVQVAKEASRQQQISVLISNQLLAVPGRF